MSRRLGLSGLLVAVFAAGFASGRLPLPAASASGPSPSPSAAAPERPLAQDTAAPLLATPAPAPTPEPRSRVVLAGDSLIYGGPLPDDAGLTADIARDRPDLDVLNYALGGDTAAGLLRRVHELVDAHPDELVLWIGTNDALADVPVASYIADVQTIIDTVHAPRTVLLTPIQDYSQPQAYVPYEQALLQLAGTDHLPVIDVHLQRTDFLPDGAHLVAPSLAQVGRQIEPLL